MFQLFKKYQSVLRFILIFLGSYLLFSLFYYIYLTLSESSSYYPDFFTHLVALQSKDVIESLGYASKILTNPGEPSLQLYINDHFLARIIEGCNSISIIILFTSFILSFFARFKITFLYIITGAVIIYIMNIVRIVILSIGIYEYPKYTSFLHGIVFPLIIYGTVFILWVFWVRLFSKFTLNEKEV
ncbi:MAG TPA: exosortase family protein XrtF [Gillisia sp.]|nr:exosortase family protein XrtF [Gillisia sp.]